MSAEFDLALMRREVFLENDDLTIPILAAKAKFKCGQFQQGLMLVEKVLMSRPDEPQLILLRGQCQGALGQMRKAISDFTKCVTLDPHNAKVGQLEVLLYLFHFSVIHIPIRNRPSTTEDCTV